jgi:hypothetical protein
MATAPMKNATIMGVQFERRIDTDILSAAHPRDVLNPVVKSIACRARHAPDRSKVCCSTVEQIQRHDRDWYASVAISWKDGELRAVHARAIDSLRWREVRQCCGKCRLR